MPTTTLKMARSTVGLMQLGPTGTILAVDFSKDENGNPVAVDEEGNVALLYLPSNCTYLLKSMRVPLADVAFEDHPIDF